MTTMEQVDRFDPFADQPDDEPMFSYEDVDEDDIPKRTRPAGAGRQVRNPHAAVINEISGTGRCKAFTVEDPGDDDERRKLVQRNVRYLRMAAHENGRSVRVYADITSDGLLRITIQDKEWHRRGQKRNDGEYTDSDE